jgi:hypothetical protein
LVQADAAIGNHPPEELATWRLPAVKILSDHLEQASAAWRAWRAPMPQDWFNLLSKDLGVRRSFRKPCWKSSKNFPQTRRRLERRKRGCWN